MDDAMKKKLMGAGTAALAAFVFGGSQIMDMDERLKALEEIHPELKQEELDEIAEELQSDEEPSAPALGKPGMSAPPIEDPAKPEEEGAPEEE